jgi:hypothetical protein
MGRLAAMGTTAISRITSSSRSCAPEPSRSRATSGAAVQGNVSVTMPSSYRSRRLVLLVVKGFVVGVEVRVTPRVDPLVPGRVAALGPAVPVLSHRHRAADAVQRLVIGNLLEVLVVDQEVPALVAGKPQVVHVVGHDHLGDVRVPAVVAGLAPSAPASP